MNRRLEWEKANWEELRVQRLNREKSKAPPGPLIVDSKVIDRRDERERKKELNAKKVSQNTSVQNVKKRKKIRIAAGKLTQKERLIRWKASRAKKS